MITTLCLVVVTLFAVVGCDKSEISTNVSFTPCLQSELRSSSEFSDKVDVEFTDKGVQIKYRNFEVTCDFTTVNVTHTFANGVLNITQQGSPNQANCICYTDVSYTINGISQNEVNVIFINDVQVYCHNDDGYKGGDVPYIPCPCEFGEEPMPIQGEAQFFIDVSNFTTLPISLDPPNIMVWQNDRDKDKASLLVYLDPDGIYLDGVCREGRTDFLVNICNFPDFAKKWHYKDGVIVHYEGLFYRSWCEHLSNGCRNFCGTIILTKLEIK